MTPDGLKKRVGNQVNADQFVNGVRAKLAKHLERQKKKGIEPKPGKLTIIHLPRKEGVPDWRVNFEKMMEERRKPPLPGPHPTKLIDAFVRDHLSPYLKELGFRKSARRFWRDQGELVEVISVWKDSYNDAWEGGFAIELGVYWKKYQEELGGHYAAETMPPAHCLLEHRLTKDMEKINDYWWKFKPNVDLGALTNEVISDLENQGFPWLKSRHGPKYIRELLDKKGHHLRKVAKIFSDAKAARPETKRRS